MLTCHDSRVSRWFSTYGLAEVADRLLVGALPSDAADVRRLSMFGVTRILNLVDDSEYQRGDRAKVATALEDAGIAEYRVNTVDYGGLEASMLDDTTAMISDWMDDGEIVYLHCRAGWQRSAAVAAGVVALRDNLDIDEALYRVSLRKPSADPLPHQREDLRRWWSLRRAHL